MASYVVMQRASGAGMDTVFVRDAFSGVALVFPVLWLLWNRLWFAALMLFIVSVGLALVGDLVIPGSGPATMLAGLVIGLFVALEGPVWRIGRFHRKDYAVAGTVDARNLDEAEIRWFTQHAAVRAGRSPATVAWSETASGAAVEPQTDMLFGFAGGESR